MLGRPVYQGGMINGSMKQLRCSKFAGIMMSRNERDSGHTTRATARPFVQTIYFGQQIL
jgi:hypothetical protein